MSDDDRDTYQEHQASLVNAIAAICDEGIITHYVVVAAGITDEGETFTSSIYSPGLPMWQAHGLLSYEASSNTPEPAWRLGRDDDED